MSVRVLTGVAFVIGGLPKFLAYGWEHDAFVRFGLPSPGAWVIAAGIIEIVGGLLLIAGRWVRFAALWLAGTMSVAVGLSGLHAGDVIPSLTIAPVLLAASLYLLVAYR